MKSKISRPEAEAELIAINRALQEAADLAQIMPHHGRALTPEMRVCLSERARQIKALHERAVALHSRVKAAGLDRKISSWAAELKLIIERTVGELLGCLGLPGGDHKSSRQENRLDLERCGVSPAESYRWQREAKLPSRDFADYRSQASRQGREPSSHGLFRLATIYVEKVELAGDSPDPLSRAFGDLQRLAGQRRRFGCMFIDAACATAPGGRAKGSPIDPRLAQLPVMELAAAEVHVYLKVTPESLDLGRKILEAWGFSRTTLLVPAMRPLDPHGSVLTVHDILLLGVRDKLGSDAQGLPPWIEDGRDLALEPGEALHHVIERISPPPCLDVFGLHPFSKNWTTAGAA